jgi:XapX domain-containing protein
VKVYLISLAVSTLVGSIYGLLHVRSPAPPVVALVGLLGILIGEQLPPLLKQIVARETSVAAWVSRQVRPHVLGHLPQGELTAASPRMNEEKL